MHRPERSDECILTGEAVLKDEKRSRSVRERLPKIHRRGLCLEHSYSYARLSLTLMRVARRAGTQLARIESTMTVPSQIQTA